MTDPHTTASWHYRNAKRHAHKTGIGMTVRERAGNIGATLLASLIVALGIVAFVATCG